jgi:hypothetical protein
MPTSLSVSNISFPQSPFLDPLTKRPAREWIQWLQYPNLVGANFANPIGSGQGGTGNTTTPANGELLIGNGTNYSLSVPTAGNGISITTGPGTLTFINSGVTSIIAGSGISASTVSGAVTLANTGVLSFGGGSTGLTPSTPSTGDITLAGTLNITNGGTGATTAANARINLGLGNGINATITTAKLTALGSNGSMTFINGILTAQTAAT